MSCTCKYGSGRVCGFCEHRAQTNKRLKKLEDAQATEHARGIAEERARVVADLRRKADIVSVMRSMEATTTARALRERADRYERGEHIEEGER